uniref:Nebulette n=1 Tax=Oncorhynchus kisutch TaxID=8019 RepID=A0A8C7CL84_ONCKI
MIRRDRPNFNPIEHLWDELERRKGVSSSLYSTLPETMETQHAKEASQLQSEKLYKEKYNAEKGLSTYTTMETLPEVSHAMEVNKQQSEVITHNAIPLIQTVHYKEKFEREFKGQKPQYNPSNCVSFKHTQAAHALTSQVKYKINQNQVIEGSMDLPNLLQLKHALHASKLQSNIEYKKKYEQSKGHYHIALDTAEQLHHRENAVLHSQVKYKEEYERNKGKSQMEFVDTQSYRVSKEAQKMQSEEYDDHIRGKALVDVDLTPGYLTARHASNVLSEKEYRKDLENDIMGKGMEISGDVLEMQRAKKATELTSQASYKQTAQLRESSYGTVTDTPELLHAAYMKDVYTLYVALMNGTCALMECQSLGFMQKKYKDEAEKLKGSYGFDTPEMERVKNNQRNISSVKYREGVGSGTAVMETLDTERVRRNQENISSVKYKKQLQATSVGVTPELERVRQNQENISSASHIGCT